MRTTTAAWDPDLGGTHRAVVVGLTLDKAPMAKAPMKERYTASLERRCK